ncbi:unnamed protein product [Rotaria magnacalcarata]|uniref:EGF-like domain-containing protein n=2 Tax=Rotaria magnacalcarata TaxID=392030 RepID=A0A816T5A2_9BILA|nr:unnamed protein product [Rotaria magnacalcarata]
MDISHCTQTNYYFIVVINLCLLIQGQFYLPHVCFMTFDNVSITSDPLNSNATIFICPTSCYTMQYLTNQQEYTLFGNETYSGNSLICKSALHDGRIAPWQQDNSTLTISNRSSKSSTFISSLRNGILSGKLIGNSYFVYRFLNDRINETSIPDVAIEHRGYIYSQNQSSSITCRSKSNLYPIQPINIDHGWKYWKENRLKYFTIPRIYTRNQSLNFCLNNNGTLMYWANSTEQEILQNILLTTIHQLFHFQRTSLNNNTLSFFIGLKQINRIKRWESNAISYNESLGINLINDEDYCTIIQSDGSNAQSLRILDHKCDDTTIYGYTLCRLLPSVIDDEKNFIYRLEMDNQSKNLTGVIDFCSELGGYPIYANNAYEWQLIQEIMLNDSNFNPFYVYTGLISETKQVENAYWIPTNISYNRSLDFIQFATPRGRDRIGYHLSKADDESYYLLYDINPNSSLNKLRFCRKNDIQSLIKQSSSCNHKSCLSKCLNITLPSQSDDTRFGFYSCMPKNSLAGIVYTQSFPEQGDFIRPNLPMDYSIALRRNYNQSLILSFEQIDKDLRYSCYQYINFDTTSTLNDTIKLFCNESNTENKTMDGISLKKDFNGLVSFSLEEKRMSGHHTRFIDYQLYDSRCQNQGIYYSYINKCICSPGFYGDQCQYSCPPGYYGQTCDFHCSGDDDYCKGLLICLPDPYGCSCYTGWYGTNCNISCPTGLYGPDCSYQCSCLYCNRFTGVCNCNGTECYQGIYNRLELQSKCPSVSASSSSNLALLIVIPIMSSNQKVNKQI